MVIPRPGSEPKAGEKACRESSRTVEPLNGLNDWNKFASFESASTTRAVGLSMKKQPVPFSPQLFSDPNFSLSRVFSKKKHSWHTAFHVFITSNN
jgi:hypothetical protein